VPVCDAPASDFVGLDGGGRPLLCSTYGNSKSAPRVIKTEFLAYVAGVVIGFCFVSLFTIYGGGASALPASAKATIAHGGLPAEWVG
jgi:hypothetical protein